LFWWFVGKVALHWIKIADVLFRVVESGCVYITEHVFISLDCCYKASDLQSTLVHECREGHDLLGNGGIEVHG
jgi:hypothetical protein